MTAFYRILVTGSREWDYPMVIGHHASQYLAEHGSITIVHGDCPTGLDRDARQWCERAIKSGMKRGIADVRHEAYPARWDDFGKDAGPIRNRYMVNLGADICLAYPTASSRGTIGCMNLATAAGIPVLNWGTIEVPGYPKLMPI